MNKRYPTKAGEANALAVPEQVSVAMEEIAADMREWLLALAVGAGLGMVRRPSSPTRWWRCWPPSP